MPIVTTVILGPGQPGGTDDATISHPGLMLSDFPYPLPLASHYPSAHAAPNPAGTLEVSTSAPAALNTILPPATIPAAGADDPGAGVSLLCVILLVMSLVMW